MARKKRKREEAYEFKLPEFDEVEFMRKEVEAAKAAIATILYALLVGVASYYLSLLGVAALAAPVGFAALYGLKYLYPLLKLDMSKFDKKAWAGNGAIFLFAWLAFWVLLLNPPFLDISPPVIHQARIEGAQPELVADGQQTMLSLGSNSSFRIEVLVTDNVQVTRVVIILDQGEGQVMQPAGEQGWFSFTVENPEKRLYTITIVAYDHQGLKSDEFRIRVNVTS